MSTGHEQCHERRRQVAVLDRRREEMTLHMVYADERAVAGTGEGLGVDHPDAQRACQPGPRGDRNGVDRGWRDPGFGERPIDDRRQRGQMRPTRQLGDDAAEHLVDVLRQNDETRELAADQHGRRGLVTRRFDAEDGVSHWWGGGGRGGPAGGRAEGARAASP